jgi:hypothetical protein
MSLNWDISGRSALRFGYDQFMGQYQHSAMGTLSYRLQF